MRAKTLFLIIIISAYGYYLHTFSGALRSHIDELASQYGAAVASVGEASDYSALNNPVVHNPIAK